ncbi:hypothetical protein [Nocardia sp. XZ_19_385]|uniref:hypothetical protein n=1 Tax=Nocardia sp. XZ_19_385 TaxID=2769488 RepID=UPI00188DE9E8|nr:hypothetical protein [Nocardia sp. XZ_19_385]
MSAAYILAIPPVVNRVNHISLELIGSATALLASVLLATISFCAFTVIALQILTDSRRLDRYVGALWIVGATVLVGSWSLSDIRHSPTLNTLSVTDLPGEIFALTYSVLMIVTGLTSLVAT